DGTDAGRRARRLDALADPRAVEEPGRRTRDEDRVRSGGEARSQDDRDRVPARRQRADADGPRVSAAGRRAVPDLARSARRRLEQQGPWSERADGPRGGG